MDDAEGEVGALLRAAGDLLVPVALDVRVVEAGEGDLHAVDLERAARVGEVDPARRVEAVAQLLPRVVDRADDRGVAVQAVPPAGLLQEVAGGVAQLGAVVVVGAEDVGAGEAHQRAERVERLGHALRVGEVVTGVDHEVGAQPGERLEPALLLALSADHVDVGDLEHPQWPHALRQHGHGDPPQPEGTDFEAGGIGEACRADRGDSQGYSVSRTHGAHRRRPRRVRCHGPGNARELPVSGRRRGLVGPVRGRRRAAPGG